MRFFLTITSILVLLISCKKVNGYEVDCNFEKKKAQNDFKYKNYTYTQIFGLYDGLELNSRKELISRLKKYNVKFDSISVSCIVFENTKYENCYAKEMNKLLKQKFGKTFFEEQEKLAIKDYVMKNIDSIYQYENCDETSRYPNSTINNQFDIIENDYFLKYKTPKNYIEKKEKYYSYTSADFILTKEGKVKDLTIESSFQNNKNKIFEKQFNQQVKEFVLKTKWIPAKIEGINVNSYYGLTIHYK
jgi:hypothetical protein